MGFSYAQLVFGGVSIFLNVLFLVCLITAFVIKRVSLRNSVFQVYGDLAEVRPNKKAKYAALFFDLFAGLCFSLFLAILTSFEFLPWYGSALLITLFLVLYWGFKSNFFLHLLVAFGIMKPNKQLYEDIEDGEGFSFMITDSPFAQKSFEPKKKLTRLVIRQLIPVLIICGVFFVLCWMNTRVCIAWEPLEVSTAFTRSLTPDHCHSPFPCHAYVVVGQNASTQMVVHFHTGRPYSNPMVYYDTVSHNGDSQNKYRFSIKAQEYFMSQLEVPRYVYFAYLSNLTPSQTYYFVAGNFDTAGYNITGGENSPFVTPEKSFLMPPSADSSESLKFITGGDLGDHTATGTMTEQVANFDSHFVALGGDLAYDNAMPACYRRWDDWLTLLEEKLVSASGRTIPLLLAIGNHCAGGFVLKPDAFTFFKTYFIHEPVAAGDSPLTLKTYRKHQVGNLVTLVLDSAIMEEPGGTQGSWIDGQLQTTAADPKNPWRTALYHVPMWPSVRSLSDGSVKATRDAWSPLFDKYSLHVGFENHDHSYKRTKPIKDQQVAEKGTIYLGDGSWGVTPRDPVWRDYIEMAAKATFFFHMELNSTTMKGRAVNAEGEVFDTFYIAK